MSAETRLTQLQGALAAQGFDALLLCYSRDVLYYAGTAQPAALLVTANAYSLFVRRAWEFVLEETWLPRDRLCQGARLEALQETLEELEVTKGRLGLALEVLPADLFLKVQEVFGNFELVNCSPLVLEQRMRKDPEEIAAIRGACEILDEGHRRVLTTLRPGMTELELAAEVEDAHRRAGHEGAFFMRRVDFVMSRGPLAAGANAMRMSGFANTVTGVGLSPAVPAGPSRRELQTGDLVVVDIPVCFQGYHGDQTRTYAVGTAPEGARDLFARLREISDRVLVALHDGVEAGTLYGIARSAAKDLGVEECFLGHGGQRADFVGHGIGLELNEPPVLTPSDRTVLRGGSVVTVELHLTHPRCGTVKLEDTVLVASRGAECLTRSPRALTEVRCG